MNEKKQRYTLRLTIAMVLMTILCLLSGLPIGFDNAGARYIPVMFMGVLFVLLAALRRVIPR